MTDKAEVFLGIIAFSTLATSLLLVVFMVVALRLVLRINRAVEKVERELTPTIAQVNAVAAQLHEMAREGAQVIGLARAQVERIDRMMGEIGAAFGDVAGFARQAFGTVQRVVGAPVRNGSALSAALAAFRTAMAVVREFRGGRRPAHADDDDALFI